MRWSAVTAISLMRWEETKTVRPSAASDFIRFRTQRMPSGSRPLTGSSKSSTWGSPRSAAAMPSRWPMPSEKPSERFFATSGGRRRPSPCPRGGPGCRTAGRGTEVVAGVPAAVHGLGVEERADLAGALGSLRYAWPSTVTWPEWGRRAPAPSAASWTFPSRWARGSRSLARPYREGRVVDGGLVAVAFRQANRFDHSPHPSKGSGRRGTRPRKA